MGKKTGDPPRAASLLLAYRKDMDIFTGMNHILLLGAGFSRNWGGWLASEAFEYLLGCTEISRSTDLRAVLWRHQSSGGFENALAEVQANYTRDPQANEERLRAMQNAIARMFRDMNDGMLSRGHLEFQNYELARMVASFLTRFDAIFTLNQDLLLEHYYLPSNVALIGPRRWDGAQLPGMQRIPSPDIQIGESWATASWCAIPDEEYRVAPRSQPFFKIHGSSNWKDRHGRPLLIMGGDKARELRLYPVLDRYMREFTERLSAPDTRLMIIGYGFRDQHINDVITNAVNNRELRIFIIDPLGGDLARSLNPTRAPGHIIMPTSLEAVFERGLSGASRRPLTDSFGQDGAIEHSKILRFFDA